MTKLFAILRTEDTSDDVEAFILSRVFATADAAKAFIREDAADIWKDNEEYADRQFDLSDRLDSEALWASLSMTDGWSVSWQITEVEYAA